MAGTWTSGNLIQKAIDLINDSTMSVSSPTTGNFWTANEFLYYLQEGQRLLALSTKFWRENKTVNLVAGTATYDLNSARTATTHATTAQYIEPVTVFIPGIGQLQYLTADELDELDPSWPTTTGVPQYWYTENLNQGVVGLFPTPNASAVSSHASMRVRANKVPALPATVATGTTPDVDIPDQYGIALVYYILFRAYLKDGELQSLERANAYEELFKAFQKRMADDASNANASVDRVVPARYL